MKYLFKEELPQYVYTKNPDIPCVYAYQLERNIEHGVALPPIDGEMLAACVRPYRLSDVYYFLKGHASYWFRRFLFRTGLYKVVPGVYTVYYDGKPGGCSFG